MTIHVYTNLLTQADGSGTFFPSPLSLDRENSIWPEIFMPSELARITDFHAAGASEKFKIPIPVAKDLIEAVMFNIDLYGTSPLCYNAGRLTMDGTLGFAKGWNSTQYAVIQHEGINYRLDEDLRQANQPNVKSVFDALQYLQHELTEFYQQSRDRMLNANDPSIITRRDAVWPMYSESKDVASIVKSIYSGSKNLFYANDSCSAELMHSARLHRSGIIAENAPHLSLAAMKRMHDSKVQYLQTLQVANVVNAEQFASAAAVSSSSSSPSMLYSADAPQPLGAVNSASASLSSSSFAASSASRASV